MELMGIKDAEFYVGFKQISLPYWQNAPNKLFSKTRLNLGLFAFSVKMPIILKYLFICAFRPYGKFVILKSKFFVFYVWHDYLKAKS
jgi:hypothetical protein